MDTKKISHKMNNLRTKKLRKLRSNLEDLELLSALKG